MRAVASRTMLANNRVYCTTPPEKSWVIRTTSPSLATNEYERPP